MDYRTKQGLLCNIPPGLENKNSKLADKLLFPTYGTVESQGNKIQFVSWHI